MHIESLLEHLGGLGSYQRRIIVFIVLTKMAASPSMVIMAFAGADPGWWCESRDTHSADSLVSMMNGSYQNCNMNETCHRHYDTETMVTIVSEWDLACEKSWVTNTIISLQMFGVLVGTIIAGYCADRYGRKKVLYSAVMGSIIFNVIAAFSVSWPMFTVLRVFLGMCVGGVIAVNYLFISEFVSKDWRSFCASLPSWGLGMFMFSGITWAIRHWKWLHIAFAATAVPAVLGWFIVPESIRWLAVKGRLDEARKVIKKWSKVNKKPFPDTAILEVIAKEEKEEGDRAKSYSYFTLVKTKALRKKTFLCCFIWFSLSVTYYAITFGVKKLSGNIFLNMMLMAILELPTMFVVLMVTAITGRRWSCASMMFFSALMCFGVAAANRLATGDIKTKLENSFAQLARCSIITVWHIVQALTSEQYPTVIRNLAYAAQSTVARVGGILAAQILSLGGKDDLMPPFVAMGVLVLLGALASMLLSETKGRALEDTFRSELEVELAENKPDTDEVTGNQEETEVLIENGYVMLAPLSDVATEGHTLEDNAEAKMNEPGEVLRSSVDDDDDAIDRQNTDYVGDHDDDDKLTRGLGDQRA